MTTKDVEDPITVTAVHESWFKAYIDVNSKYPQTALALTPMTGSTILDSLVKDEVDLSYLVQSMYTPEQMPKLRDDIAIRHRAFGVKWIPSGYKLEAGEKELPDSYLKSTWTYVARTTTRAAMNYIFDDSSGILRKYSQAPEKDHYEKVDLETVLELERVSRTAQYHDKLPQVAALFKAAAASLGTRRALAIVSKRKQIFLEKKDAPEEDKKKYENMDMDQVCLLAKIVKWDLEQHPLLRQSPPEVSSRFRNNIICWSE